MTVIAWDGKTLAADSLEADDHGFFVRKCKKLYRLKSGGMLGESGMSDNRGIIALFDNIKDENDMPTRAELEATKAEGSYIVVLPDKTVFEVSMEYLSAEEGNRFVGQVMKHTHGPLAVGHGSDYAKASMTLGKDAVSGVKLACKWSLFCQGPVQTMKLEDKPKEKIKRVRKPAAVAEGE